MGKNGHILFEGGSTAQGLWGDEAHLMGYAGRLSNYYFGYNRRLAGDGLRVFTHTNGVAENAPEKVAGLLPTSIEKARTIQESSDLPIVGVFALRGYFDFAVRRGEDEGELFEGRQQSLAAIRETCGQQGVHAIYLEPPRPDERSRLNGLPVDLDLYRRQEELAVAELPNLIPFSTMVGENDTSDYVDQTPSHLGLHPNARGYDRMARYLIPLIDEGLGIDSRLA